VALGFKRIGPVVHSALLDRSDAALLLYRPPTADLFSFVLAANDPAVLDDLGRDFVLTTEVEAKEGPVDV
jgi:hypothetical protein